MKNLYIVILITFGLGQDYSLEFDGEGDYIHINNIDAYSGINSFTFSSWVKLHERDSWEDNMFLWNKDHYPNYSQSSISVSFNYNQNPRHLRINTDMDGSGSYSGFAEYYENDFDDWDWHLLTLVYESNDEVTLYIDGEYKLS